MKFRIALLSICLFVLSGCSLINGEDINTNILEVENTETTEVTEQTPEPPVNSIRVSNIPKLISWDQTGCEWANAKVLDADTLEVGGDLVRMIGVKTPRQDLDSGLNQYFTKEAMFFVNDVTGNEKVCFKTDSLVPNTDNFFRKQRYVYSADGIFINDSLVRWGYAKVLDELNFEKKDVFYAKQKGAMAENLGIWNKTAEKRYYENLGYESVEAEEKDRVKKIYSSSAKDFVGKTVTVVTTIESTFNNNGEIFLNSEKLFNDPNNFTLVIPILDVPNFSSRGINPMVTYRRKTYEVSGKIQESNGNIRMIITSPEDLMKVE